MEEPPGFKHEMFLRVKLMHFPRKCLLLPCWSCEIPHLICSYYSKHHSAYLWINYKVWFLIRNVFAFTSFPRYAYIPDQYSAIAVANHVWAWPWSNKKPATHKQTNTACLKLVASCRSFTVHQTDWIDSNPRKLSDLGLLGTVGFCCQKLHYTIFLLIIYCYY